MFLRLARGFASKYQPTDANMNKRVVYKIFPPPGLDLKLPSSRDELTLGWTPQQFFKKIGYGTTEYADRFKTLDEVFVATRVFCWLRLGRHD